MIDLHSLKLTANAPENRPKRPKRKRSYFNRPFSGAKTLVSERVQNQTAPFVSVPYQESNHNRSRAFFLLQAMPLILVIEIPEIQHQRFLFNHFDHQKNLIYIYIYFIFIHKYKKYTCVPVLRVSGPPYYTPFHHGCPVASSLIPGARSKKAAKIDSK